MTAGTVVAAAMIVRRAAPKEMMIIVDLPVIAGRLRIRERLKATEAKTEGIALEIRAL